MVFDNFNAVSYLLALGEFNNGLYVLNHKCHCIQVFNVLANRKQFLLNIMYT